MKNFKPNENFHYYLYWMSERMEIFWKKMFQEETPYTQDPILQNFKFTNVYRCLDRVSQYLIGKVIYDKKGLENDRDTEDIFFRILLFKHFNSISTWEALEQEFGEIGIDLLKREKDLIQYLSEVQKHGPIYSSAYMMTASFMRNSKILDRYGVKQGEQKHSSYLKILKKDLYHNPKNLYKILRSSSLEELQINLESINTIGKFLSMQYAIDLNYSLLFNFDENEHIVAGPGAEKGILRTFTIQGKPDFIEVIKWVQQNLDKLFSDYGYKFQGLPGRQPTLIDVQNCFCEIDKYLRSSGIKTEGVEVEGSRIKSNFKENKEEIKWAFPPKWEMLYYDV